MDKMYDDERQFVQTLQPVVQRKKPSRFKKPCKPPVVAEDYLERESETKKPKKPKKSTLKKGSFEHKVMYDAMSFMEKFGVSSIQIGSKNFSKNGDKVVVVDKRRRK